MLLKKEPEKNWCTFINDRTGSTKSLDEIMHFLHRRETLHNRIKDKLLIERNEFGSKCRHGNSFLEKEIKENKRRTNNKLIF